jgi:hypothetical protein
MLIGDRLDAPTSRKSSIFLNGPFFWPDSQIALGGFTFAFSPSEVADSAPVELYQTSVYIDFFYSGAAQSEWTAVHATSISSLGFFAAMRRRVLAAPDGSRRPCSHSWSVRTDTPRS